MFISLITAHIQCDKRCKASVLVSSSNIQAVKAQIVFTLSLLLLNYFIKIAAISSFTFS